MEIVIVFMAAAVYGYVGFVDLKTMEIPDRCHVFLLVLGVVDALMGRGPSWGLRLAACLLLSLPLFFLSLASRGGIGGGDIKLLAASGFLLGPVALLRGAVLGFAGAGILGLLLLALGRSPKKEIPLGPFLGLGFIGTMLWPQLWQGSPWILF